MRALLFLSAVAATSVAATLNAQVKAKPDSTCTNFPDGRVECKIIRGTTRGIIKAHRVRLEKTANVDSEIYQDAFSAEEGARIKGSMRSYDDHVAMAAPIHMHGHTAEKPVSASLYQLLDAARSAQHAHLSVAQ